VTTRLAALLVLLVVGQSARAQGPGTLSHAGSEYFRFALHRHGIEPLSEPRQAIADPLGTLIVITGRVTELNQILNGNTLANYLESGGAILIAADGPSPPPGVRGDWAAVVGVGIGGSPITADRRNCYKQLPGRPYVRPKVRVIQGGPSPFDLFEGVAERGPTAIATEYPSEIRMVPDGGRNRFLVKHLAGYPEGARRTTDDRQVAEDVDFAVSIEPQRGILGGRMIVLADHGVFFNGMMGFVKDPAAENGVGFDNGNWVFANRTIHWLQGGQGVMRSRCLFVEDSHVIDRFAVTVPNANPPIPKIAPDRLANGVLNAMNPLIDAAQERDFFNRVIEGWLGFPRIVRAFLLTLTVVFLVACLRWLLRGRRRAEPAAIMTPQLQASLVPRGGVLRQRTAAQIEVGNLYDAARRRVRERFDVLGGRPGPAGQMPPVLTANDLPDGPVLHHSVRWLWALGYGDTPIGIPPADWDRTNVLLERVTARAARGDWSFGQEV
jgi:hypothetical protein